MFANPLLRALASLKLSAALLILFAVAIAKATFIENDMGAEGARALVYNARWFEILLALFCLNMLMVLLKGIPYKPRQAGSVIVHVSMLVILVSAGVTRWFGFEGVMHIREGDSASAMYSREPHLQLDRGDTVVTKAVRLYAPGQSFAEAFELDGVEYTVSVDEYWPRHVREPYEAETGPAALAATVGGRGLALELGKPVMERGTRFLFADGLDAASSTASPWGDLRVRVEGETASAPIGRDLPVTLEVAGWRFDVVNFQAGFKVGGAADFDSPMTNPAVKVEITDPDGGAGQRYLFAYNPDFAMNHSGGGTDYSELDMVFGYDASVVLARDAHGVLQARATIPLTVEDGGHRHELPAGGVFAVSEDAVYATGGGSTRFGVDGFFEHLGYRNASGSGENAPDVAFVTVTDSEGAVDRTSFAVNDERGGPVTLGDTRFVVRIEPVVIDLPYAVHLDDFVLKNYPGSMNPASYESHVRLVDEEAGIDGEPVRIYMNHPLTHRGYKHFQSSYHRDLEGTILSVNYDPGKIPTYVGYVLITLGFLLIFARDLLWPRKDQTDGGANHDD